MFKRPFCQSDVVLGCVVCSHLCVVNYIGGQEFVVKRALVFVTAIALYLVICISVSISYFLVVFVDDRFHVVHTAVANFDVILVEKAVVFVLFREVLRETNDHYCKPRQNPKQKIRTDFQVPPRKQVLPSEQLTQKQYPISFFLTPNCN